MCKPPRKTPEPAGDAREQADKNDALDEVLKQLGDEFLDEDVPESLLEVLRRGRKPSPEKDSGQSDVEKDPGGTTQKTSED